MGSPKPNPKSEIRLQKFLAECGVGSRRACELLIDQGRVSVDGQVVRRQGVTLDPARHDIRVRGRPVRRQALVYLALHKPRQILCTARDPGGRRTVIDLVPQNLGRLFTVGRLDRDSEGLLLLTTDGAFAHRLAHPRHHVAKIYRVWSARALSDGQVRSLVKGLECDGEFLQARRIKRLGDSPRGHRYELTLEQGRNRQIRRMFAALGVDVTRLKRTAIGPLKLGRLPTGEWRMLTAAEIRLLQRAGGSTA